MSAPIRRPQTCISWCLVEFCYKSNDIRYLDMIESVARCGRRWRCQMWHELNEPCRQLAPCREVHGLRLSQNIAPLPGPAANPSAFRTGGADFGVGWCV